MSQFIISISKTNIYHIAEGISVTISQHNGGTPTYEQLWASPDESRKLDIYYREAISDLEKKLQEWIDSSSPQFNLSDDSSDYTLALNMSRYWPSRLSGLLQNKVQDYLVHAVTAGWLNDFDGLNVKQDYQAMAVQDLTDVRDIVCQRAFDFDTSIRGVDGNSKPTPDDVTPDSRMVDGDAKHSPDDVTPGIRMVDGDAKHSPEAIDPDIRKVESDAKAAPNDITPDARKEETSTKETPDAIDPDIRKVESDAKVTPDSLTPDARKEDTQKHTLDPTSPAGFRRKDTVARVSNDDVPPYCKPKHLRHRDNAIVERHDDYTDWSGTGIAFRDRIPPHLDPDCHMLPPLPPVAPLPQRGYEVSTSSPRVHRNMGYTPSRIPPRPVPGPVPAAAPAVVPGASAPGKDPRIPDDPTHPNYPPITSDGVTWSDMSLYDAAGSERAMVHHCPKPGCDGRDPDLKWDIND